VTTALGSRPKRGSTFNNQERMMPDSGAIGNTVKLLGEALLPGASQLVDGNVKSGLAHALVGVVVGAIIGPIGMLVVKADSFSKSVSDKSLYTQAAELVSQKPATSDSEHTHQ
jgi:hypothetical protein